MAATRAPFPGFCHRCGKAVKVRQAARGLHAELSRAGGWYVPAHNHPNGGRCAGSLERVTLKDVQEPHEPPARFAVGDKVEHFISVGGGRPARWVPATVSRSLRRIGNGWEITVQGDDDRMHYAAGIGPDGWSKSGNVRLRQPAGQAPARRVLEGARWASVSRTRWPSAGAFRHITVPGHPTSACSITGFGERVWRGDSRKPKCQACLAVAVDPDGVA